MDLLIGTEKPVISIVSTCKGRLDNLKRSFASLKDLNFGGHIEYVVVDYDCPDEAGKYFKDIELPELLSITLQFVENKPYFQPSHARNVGALTSTADYLLFVDADTLLTQEFVDTAVMPVLRGEAEYSRIRFCGRASEKMGTLCLSYDLFTELRGYDEAIKNWGKEDEDIYNRLQVHDKKGIFFEPEVVDVIHHDNEVRTRFYEDKRIAAYGKPKSNDDNARLIRDAKRAVNPDIYGAGEVETYIRWKAW